MKELVSYIREHIIEGDPTDPESNAYTKACQYVWQTMPSYHRATLKQLVEKGPVWDGDIAFKDARGWLFEYGLASRACVKNEQGYTIANYVDWNIVKRGEESEQGKVA